MPYPEEFVIFTGREGMKYYESIFSSMLYPDYYINPLTEKQHKELKEVFKTNIAFKCLK